MIWERSAIILVLLFVIELVLVTGHPTWLSDDNLFFRDFIDQDLLSFLGIILTISVGFLAQLHLNIGKLEDRLDKEAVREIRNELRSTAKTLISLFFASLLVTFIKPLINDNVYYVAIINGAAIFIIVFFFLILADIILAIFDFDL